MSLASFIKGNPKIKKFVHWMLIPKGQARPRVWVKLVNPLFILLAKDQGLKNG
jgi:hypothetical protein